MGNGRVAMMSAQGINSGSPTCVLRWNSQKGEVDECVITKEQWVAGWVSGQKNRDFVIMAGQCRSIQGSGVQAAFEHIYTRYMPLKGW